MKVKAASGEASSGARRHSVCVRYAPTRCPTAARYPREASSSPLWSGALAVDSVFLPS